MSGRPINEARQIAIEFGLNTYTGARHAACGTDQRYTSGGSCVHCARIIATEQREARKILRQQAQAPLDIPETDGLDADDAEARRQAAIDELM